MGQPCPPCHQVPAPSLSSLALSAPSVLPALGCLPVLPEVEVAASARSPILLPCVYRVRTGPRPGRSRLLSASCRPGRALRFCSKHGRRRGVCAPHSHWLPAPFSPQSRTRWSPRPAPLPAALGRVPPGAPWMRPWAPARPELSRCSAGLPRFWTQGSFSSCFPFKLKQDLPRLSHFEASSVVGPD